MCVRRERAHEVGSRVRISKAVASCRSYTPSSLASWALCAGWQSGVSPETCPGIPSWGQTSGCSRPGVTQHQFLDRSGL